MIKFHVLLFFVYTTHLSIRAQNKVTLFNSQSGQPVVGATIALESVNGYSGHYISNEAGEIFPVEELPFVMQIRHISYKSITDTIYALPAKFDLSPGTFSLEQVVVTGQHSPQSVRNTVYKVRTIDKEQIVRQNAVTMQDILANQLNIRFSRDNTLGTNNISLQGLNGQNIKILLDGVPVTGRSGLANEIDVNQININTIEKIEIVEGPMAVSYGADALAGVINIITKKDAEDALIAEVILHEESVENKFNILEEGIHSGNVLVGVRPAKPLYFQGDVRLNRFGGWTGNPKLFDSRNRQWLPKDQQQGSILLRYEKKRFSIYHRFDMLSETITDKGILNDSDLSVEPSANDRDFITKRINHQFQAGIKIGSWQLQPVLSYTSYDRNTEAYTTYPESGTNFGRRTIQSIAIDSWFNRNTITRKLGEAGSLQLGVETAYHTIEGSSLSPGKKNIGNLDFFSSAEIRIGSKLQIRPGIRYGYSTLFSVIPTPSFNLRYAVTRSTSIRASYGRGFRTPSSRELYHYFVDTNHNIIGNPELLPEYSHNISADISTQYKTLNISLNSFYNHIVDQITFFTPENSNAPTTYLNLDDFKSTGLTLNTSLSMENFQVNGGASYIGRRQQLTDTYTKVPGFIFGLEIQGNITYTISSSKTILSIFYKYNGPLRSYRLVDEAGEGRSVPVLQQINSFNLSDFSLSQPLGGSVIMGLGIRNIFNVKSIGNNLSGGGAHSDSEGATSVGYGRSYFMSLRYSFKKNS